MSAIWSDLQSKVCTEIEDSGFLKAIFKDVEFLDLEAGESPILKLGVGNSISLRLAQRDLQGLIREKLKQVLNRSEVQVQFEASQSRQGDQLALLMVEDMVPEPNLRSPCVEFRPKWFLNPDYKLESFVNGEHSDFAYKAVSLLTTANQTHLRQLFLYGPSGMGKTHLLHSLGWQFKEMQPGLNVKIFSADEFINDYHAYIAKKQMPEFRGKYRLKTDVLLIDDIHSMARAKGAQEELFNIFNYFEQAGKFIAFTCDKSPHTLEGFEPRLLTRFQGGLSAEVVTPDLATRIRILEFKQLKYGFNFSDQALQRIASSVTNSVRSLEGAILKVGAYQKLKGSLVSFEEMSRLIPSGATASEGKLTAEEVLNICASSSGLKVSDLKSTSRKREIVLARSQAMHRLRNELSLSYSEIGRIFCKDHSSVMSAIKRARG